MAKILVLHGPNLNLLGTREPEVYGFTTLAEIDARLLEMAQLLGHSLDSFQSNSEGDLVNRIQQARIEAVEAVVINPAAYTHTSVAIRDALLGIAVPFVEIHLSNPHTREDFRKYSYFSDVAVGVVCGFGVFGYECALQAILNHLAKNVEE